jgi:hypothetical protein
MPIRKVKKDFWEEIFVYPSFNIRFGVVLTVVLAIFCVFAYFLLFKLEIINGTSDQIAVLNLIIQSATLVLGVFAAYYALRQLVETRFNSLDESGMHELKRSHYSSAFQKWKEAFYIRPEARVFTNMCESLLLVGDYDTFDQYVGMSYSKSVFKKEIFQESSDQIILLYLTAIRHLLVKNQGEAEKHVLSLIELAKNEGLLGFQWDFIDLQRSPSYQDLSGECKNIADNLISYLSKTIQPVRKDDFESGNLASQNTESPSDI